VTFDNANVRAVLGQTPTADLSRAWLASAYSLIKHGMVPDKTKGAVLSSGAASGAPTFPEFTIPAVVQGLAMADGGVAPTATAAAAGGAGGPAA